MLYCKETNHVLGSVRADAHCRRLVHPLKGPSLNRVDLLARGGIVLD